MHQHEHQVWRKEIAAFEKPRLQTSLWQIVNSVLPFFAFWFAAYQALSISYGLTLILAVGAGVFLIRVFIIFHDCCHRSFFRSKRANEIVGTLMGILTFCPYLQWRYFHSVHHAGSGNLDRRGVGDIWTMTVDEYLAAPRKRKIMYRLYRNPVVMFGLGPIYIFIWNYRFNRKEALLRERLNTYVTNIAIVAIVAFLCATIGWQNFLLVEAPVFLVSGVFGIWLFYVQHQFENTYFEEDAEWDFYQAAMHGSSFYNLPKILHWLTGNIGYHHIHHLSPRVPNYYLEDVHHKRPQTTHVQFITLATSLKSLRYRVWDEETKSFVHFRDLREHELIKEEG